MKEVKVRTLVRDLEDLGIEDGCTLGLGISLRSVGWVESGPNGLIDAILRAIGNEGTLFMPTHTMAFRLGVLHRPIKVGAAARAWRYIFDWRSTPPITGAVPAALLDRPDSVRSRHPTSSIGAIGRKARLLTAGHDDASPSYSPYSALADLQGSLLTIGIGERLVGFRHQAQYLAGLLTVLPPYRGVRYRREDGSVGLYVQRDMGGCTQRLPELNEHLEAAGLIRRGRIGSAESLLVDAGRSLETMAWILREDPAAYLCDRIHCLWCREIERRLDLYGRMVDPEPFQANRTLRSTVRLLNAMRYRDSTAATLVLRAMSSVFRGD